MATTITNRPIVCLEFEGVCTANSGLRRDGLYGDPPTPGLFDFIEKVSGVFDVHVWDPLYSPSKAGRRAMMEWFAEHGKLWRMDMMKGPNVGAVMVRFPEHRPQAHLFLCHRGATFTGEWPSITDVVGFEPRDRKSKTRADTLAYRIKVSSEAKKREENKEKSES